MSTESPNGEPQPRVYRPCVTGLKCAPWYRADYLRRIQEHPKDQGTGDIVEDLTAKLRGINSTSRVEGRECTDACPIPGQKSNVVCPDGKLYKVFWEDLDSLIARWE
jgi:hypothetical protein